MTELVIPEIFILGKYRRRKKSPKNLLFFSTFAKIWVGGFVKLRIKKVGLMVYS